MTKIEKLLRDLIALPSVNPAFLPPGDPHAGEHRVADFLAGVASRAGLDVQIQRVSSGRSNVLAVLSPRGKVRQRIVLAPHMDTVGGSPLPGEFFKPKMRNGRLYGRGACDTKGSIASMFSAVLEVASAKQRPSETEIVFAALVDEECAQTGSRTLGASGLKADLAIVGEPTLSQVVTAHKGVLWVQLLTHGKAAHGSRPELGRNAVHEMALIVDALETDYAQKLKKTRHPILGAGTINVGSIEGGKQPNIVPADCIISVDRRTLPGEKVPAVIEEMRALLRKKGLKPEFRNMQPLPCLPLFTDARQPLVAQLMKAANQKKPLGVNYFSDAGVLAEYGMASVLFGPGDIAQAHTQDEWIAVKQLEQAKETLVIFLKSLA
ncbi:MAG: Peptidase dimerization domain protein [Verrucomicrobiales bacterium]|nr:Peptidase dimerization domain protein [Verrucomicrobiales bacterium]